LSTLSTIASTGISSLSTSISTGITSLSTGISSLSTSISTGITSLSTGISSLSTSTSTGITSVSTGISSLSTGISNVSIGLATEISTRSTQVSSLSASLSTLSTSTSTGISTLSSLLRIEQQIQTTMIIVPINTTTIPTGQEPNLYQPYSLSTTPNVDGWYYNCALFPLNYSASQASNFINWNIIPIDLRGQVNLLYANITQVYAVIFFPTGTFLASNLPYITVNCNNATLRYSLSTSLSIQNSYNSGETQIFQCTLQPLLTTNTTVAYGNIRQLASTVVSGSINTATIINNIAINTNAIPTYASAIVSPSPQNFIVQDIFVENIIGSNPSALNQTIQYKFTTANVLNKYLYRVTNNIYQQLTKSTISTTFPAPNYILNNSLSYIG
jgi:hypothetical protein